MTDNEYKVHENNFVNSRTVTVIYSTVATNIIRMLYVMMIMMIVITIIVIISRERERMCIVHRYSYHTLDLCVPKYFFTLKPMKYRQV